jgi:hypothetical protein
MVIDAHFFTTIIMNVLALEHAIISLYKNLCITKKMISPIIFVYKARPVIL